jgi:hypothetical protein
MNSYIENGHIETQSMSNLDVQRYLESSKMFNDEQIKNAILSGNREFLVIQGVTLDSDVSLRKLMKNIGYPCDESYFNILSVVRSHLGEERSIDGMGVAGYLMNRLLGISSITFSWSDDESIPIEDFNINFKSPIVIRWDFFRKIHKAKLRNEGVKSEGKIHANRMYKGNENPY